MSVLENFKNIPRSPYGGQGSNVIFFLQICNEVPGEKKRGGHVAPTTGDRPLSPTPGATGQWARQGGRSPLLRATGGPVPPPHGRPGQAAYIRPPPHSLLIWPKKIHKKSRKKRGVRRRKAAKLYRIPHLWSTGNFHMNPLIFYNNLI